MKRITFVLPSGAKLPCGGYKVVFEYANKLVNDAYKVNIVFPATLLWKERSLKYKIKGILRYFYFKVHTKNYLPHSWFSLDKKISTYWVPTLEEKYIPNSDYIFATACQTAEYVNNYTKKKGKKYYLIQGYENWEFSEERLLKTWKFKMSKIVISKWLYDVGKNIDEKSYLVYNGLDFKKFNIMPDIKREKSIIMLYHELKLKGTEIVLQAIEEVKRQEEDIKIKAFGVYDRPKNLPSYIEYYKSPSQEMLKKLYNQSMIYVGASYGEGWGLTVAEAMQCGCAIACTNAKGYNEIVKNKKTGLLSEVGNYKKLLENILILLKNDSFREELSKNGSDYIKKFEWERSYQKLKKIIEKG